MEPFRGILIHKDHFEIEKLSDNFLSFERIL